MTTRTLKSLTLRLSVIGILLGLTAIASARADQLGYPALIVALRQGGYVLLMRHASSPRTLPDKSTADPENITLERQLDAAGRDTARSMGDALRKLRVPIGEVLSSPTYRARETIKIMGFGVPQTFPELGDGGKSMQPTVAASWTAWLRAKVATSPSAGTNLLIVTHMPNILNAFGRPASGLTDGGTLVFHPDGHGGADLVARVKIDEWRILAVRFP